MRGLGRRARWTAALAVTSAVAFGGAAEAHDIGAAHSHAAPEIGAGALLAADAPQWSINKSPLQGVEQTAPAHVLVFTETAAFRHTDAIDNGTPLLRAALEQAGVTSEHTENSSIFNDTDLARFDALVMFQTSGDPWTASEKAALEKYQRAGGGIVAIHNATDMRGNYKWWDDLVGSLMPGHAATGNSPGLQGQVIVEDKAHPSTKHLPGTALDALGRVVQLLDQRPGQRARAAHDGRVDVRPRAATGWATTIRSRGASRTTAAAPGSPAWATSARTSPSPRCWRTSSAASSGPRASSPATAAARSTRTSRRSRSTRTRARRSRSTSPPTAASSSPSSCAARSASTTRRPATSRPRSRSTSTRAARTA